MCRTTNLPITIIGCLGALALALLGTAAAQEAVDITSEPHHQLLLENDKVRAFAVAIGPHEQTPLVRHEHNFLVITLRDSEIAIWAEGRAGVITYSYGQNDTRFYYGGPARALRNDTPNEYRNLTIEFLGDKVTTYGYHASSGHWDYGTSALPPPVDPAAKFVNTLPLGAATAKDIQLLPDDDYPAPEKPAAELVVALSGLELKNGDRRIRKDAGDLFWMDPGRKAKLVNDAAGPARLLLIEMAVAE